MRAADSVAPTASLIAYFTSEGRVIESITNLAALFIEPLTRHPSTDAEQRAGVIMLQLAQLRPLISRPSSYPWVRRDMGPDNC